MQEYIFLQNLILVRNTLPLSLTKNVKICAQLFFRLSSTIMQDSWWDSNALSIAQAIMENTLAGIEDADVYIDDVGAFSKDSNHHSQLLADILHCLRKNGFHK